MSMRDRFALSEEQQLLRESVHGFFAKRPSLSSDERASWSSFAHDLGLSGLALPAARGGLGGDMVDMMIVMEEIGEALAPDPFLEAVVLAGAIIDAIEDARATALLGDIAAGTRTFAVAIDERETGPDPTRIALSASRADDGWRLSGTKTMVAGIAQASHLLVLARSGGVPGDRTGLSLYLVDPAAPGIRTSSLRTIDGRGAAIISFDDAIVPSEALLGQEGDAIEAVEKGLDVAIAAMGAEAIGIMRRMLRDTIDYVMQRHQFGQRLADFQVLRHRIADMAIRIDSATSAVWLATMAQSDTPIERARACSTAKATIADACRYVGQNAVQLHGGMGMTDELVLGRYFRRSTAIEAAFGSSAYHLARFCSLPSPVDRDESLSPDDAAFRDEVRTFLDAELTDELRDAGMRCTGVYNEYGPANAWHRILARRGWSVPAWPVEYGGTGWTPAQLSIFASELTAAGAPRITPNATNMVAPVIMAFGTEEQKARYLPAIRSGDDWWAQGYSEPGAGSDLASLNCRAVRDGEDYVINGSKIWTTHAHFSNRIFCLVRTARLERPQQGISFLLFDLDLPGITIRPIISISGEHELNEVFFEDVRVPVSSLLGAENDGWTVAKYLLQHERSGASSPFLRARLERIHKRAARATGSCGGSFADDPVFAQRLAAADMRIAVLAMQERRVFAGHDNLIPTGAIPSMMKVLATELRQHLTELAIEIEGLDAILLPSEATDEGDVLASATDAMATYFNDRAASIYAGTNEVQRNIIANALIR